MNIVTVLEQQAALMPERVALVDVQRGQQRQLTFRDVARQSAQAARLFSQAGLQAGDVVLVAQPMSAELYIALLGMFRLGLQAMFVDPSAGREQIARCCELVAPRALFGSQKAQILRILHGAIGRIPIRFSVGWAPGAISFRRMQHVTPFNDIYACDADTPALLTFTSGSTGVPKCVVRSHGFLLAQHAALVPNMELAPGLIDMPTLPIFVLANLASGVTSVIADADLRRPGAIEPERLIKQIDDFGIERISASPALLERVVEYCEQHDQQLRSLEMVFVGGAPVFPNLLARLERTMPNARIRAVYGSTEAEPIAHIDQHEIATSDRRAMLGGAGLLAGKPVSEIELRVIRDSWGQAITPLNDAEFATFVLPANETGEIVVSGEHVLRGYLHGRGNSETKFMVDEQVWHRTGDAGYLDDQGRLWLQGRCAALIRDQRGTLAPFAVECAAQSFAAVRRAALVSIDGKRVLCIETRHELSHQELNFIQQTLSWAALDEVRVCSLIPVDARHNAKVDYPALQRLLANEHHF